MTEDDVHIGRSLTLDPGRHLAGLDVAWFLPFHLPRVASHTTGCRSISFRLSQEQGCFVSGERFQTCVKRSRGMTRLWNQGQKAIRRPRITPVGRALEEENILNLPRRRAGFNAGS